MVNPIDLEAAFSAVTHPATDTKAITKIVPDIIRQNDVRTAVSLLRHYHRNDGWLPEALSLFMVDGASARQQKEMISAVFPRLTILEQADQTILADCNARIGRYGFSFPQWRFVAQGLGRPSLIERYGMTRAERPTDVRNPDLPKSDPQRDQYGIGFIKNDNNWTIEYRRAYILCSHHDAARPVTLLVRNSSYFFGRDRLPSAAYVAWEPLSPGQLADFDETCYAKGGPFTSWENAFNAHPHLTIKERIQRVKTALDHMDSEDNALSLWLRREGRPHLQAFIANAAQKQTDMGKTDAPFYLAHIPANRPPWFPVKTVPATTASDSDNLSPSEGLKLVLLSGPQGDLPVKPSNAISPAAYTPQPHA